MPYTLQCSQRWEQHIQLLHQRLHVEAVTKDEQDGVVASDSTQNLVDALIVDGNRDSTRIARLSADDAHVAREGDVGDVVRNVGRDNEVVARVVRQYIYITLLLVRYLCNVHILQVARKGGLCNLYATLLKALDKLLL